MKFALAVLLGSASAMMDEKYFPTERFIDGPDANGCYSDTDLIKMSEGYRACEYVDTTGHKTVCYGYNLERSCARSDISSVGGDFDKVYSGGCLTQSQCNKLLDIEVGRARSGERDIFGSSVSCGCASSVLVDMTYNLGESQLRSFNTFDSLMKQGKWKDAADDLAGTAWCRQVGSRCSRDRSQIEKC